MKKINNIVLVIAVIVAAMLHTSCDSSVFYEENLKVNKKGWNVDDKLYYTVDVKDTAKLYDFYVNIRNTTDFPYQNVFLFVNTTFPNGSIAHDTLECLLADKEGYWLGKGNGNIKDNRFLFKPRVIFPMSGTYKFEIEQAMRDKDIEGLSNIGIRIQYTTIK